MARALMVALLLALAGAIAPAHADPHGWGWGHNRVITHYHWDNPLGSFLGGAVGGVVGNWIGNQFSRNRDDEAPDALEPWSKAWFGYCSRRYRSFDPESGTYLAFDGERRFCK